MYRSFSFKALRDSFKNEKQILKEKIKELIKTKKINDVDPIHGTALNRAVKIGDKKLINKLLDKKVDIDNAIYFAIGHEHTLEEIKTLISLSPAELLNEFLYKSVHKGRLDLVKYFIEEKKFDVNTTINNPLHGGAILSIAAIQELIDVINYLLEKKAIPSQGVISAILKGNVEILKKLFEYGATAKDNYSEDLVALLVNAAIPTNDPTYCKSSNSETKEDLSNYVKTLEFLLKHGGNPNAEILERGTVILIVLSALMMSQKMININHFHLRDESLFYSD